jgi:hypothetical protein
MIGLERMLEPLDDLRVEIDADADEMVGRHLDAERMGGSADEAEQDRGPSAPGGRLVDDVHEAGGDQPAGHGGDGGRAEREAPGDLGAGDRALTADQPEDGRPVEIADEIGGRLAHRGSFGH